MSWLRLDDGFASHPKIASLSDREFRVWVRLLCYLSRYRSPDGVVTAAARSEVPGLSGAAVKRFAAMDLLDLGDDVLRVHDWEHYLPKRDKTNAERQQRHRERNAESNALHNGEVTVLPRERTSVRSRPVPSQELPNQQQQDQTGGEPEVAAADLNELLDKLDVRDAGLRFAAHEDPDRAAACAQRALDIATTNPAGMFRRLLESGETPLVKDPPKPPCPLCLVGGGLHLAGCELSEGAA